MDFDFIFDKDEDDIYTLITTLGVLKIKKKEISKVCSELGINLIETLGPYNVVSLNIHPFPNNFIEQSNLINCYISYNGTLFHCSKDERLSIPINGLYRGFYSNNSFIFSFDKENYGKLLIDEKEQYFYLGTAYDIVNSNIIEVYNLYRKGDYNFIINPSDNFLEMIANQSKMCLTDKSGWCIVDIKNEIEY
ncbi:hypothetical protein [Lumpy skin disease virus]|uniref:LS124 n=1 Tax=Lumpy skin disease virus TaxID=59509 RepID=Q77GB1_LSDV|nr:hypothetical protein LSDVgp124 [Lumpy skin disease virus NI-2490]AAN02692.1 hypothetical protein [Lumpy skin disease virus NW-LW]AAN02849.1 hypothetical protein [Lumpy skin disease virus]AAK85085.1 LSDV124 hypothetical protein [Lumpy skin disease virus NI-2490]AOE47700.1 hypothetical protein [Lumpy skin disease virus]AOO78684.1 hypothetical protein [Lumpy skin disease virus]